MDADLFDEWFRIADRDRDGKVSGAEAVDFFQKSGLSKETLFEAGFAAVKPMVCLLCLWPYRR